MELGLPEFVDMTTILTKESTLSDPLFGAILQPYGSRFPTIYETLCELMIDETAIRRRFHADDGVAFSTEMRRLRMRPQYLEAHAIGLDVYRKLKQLAHHRLTQSHEPGQSPVHFLPVEVLSHCLSFLAAASPSDGTTGLNPTLQAMLLVCKHWGYVVDHTPELWTTVTTRDEPRLILASVERSVTLPLSAYIEVDSGYEAGNDRAQALALVMAVLPRIRDLNVNFDSVSLLELMNGAPGAQASRQAIIDGLNGAALSLEHISIKGPAHLDDGLFAGQAPLGLRSVSLYHCTGSPVSLFPTHLTSLSIGLSEAWDTLDEMLLTLGSMPSLIDFCWDTESYSDIALGQYITNVTLPEQSVSLPNLETFELEAQLECAGVLMRYLVLSPQTSITVHGGFLHVPRAHETRFTNMLGALDQGFIRQYTTAFNDAEGCFKRLSVTDFKDDDYVGFSALAEGYNRDERPLSLEYGASFTLHDTGEYLAIFHRMLRWPGLGTNIVCLTVHKRRLLDESWQWGEVLRLLPRLEEVELDGPAGRAFVSTVASSDPLVETDVTFAPIRYCCFLQKLVLRETKLGNGVMRRLQECLDLRANSGCPPVALSVFRCTIAREVVEALKGSSGVAVTYWDGKEGWWDERKYDYWLVRENHDTDEEDNFHSDGSEYLGDPQDADYSEDVDMDDSDSELF